MGIRPSVMLLCGIHNLEYKGFTITDKRWQPQNGATYPAAAYGGSKVILPYKNPLTLDGKKPSYGKWLRDNTIKTTLSKEKSEEAKEWHELIHWDSEYGLGNVIGYVVDTVPNGSKMAYALTPFLEGELNKVSAGFKELEIVKDYRDVNYNDLINYLIWQETKERPEMLKKEYWSGDETYGSGSVKYRRKSALSGVNRFKKIWKNGWLYPSFSEEMLFKFAPVTSYLFNQLGLKVPMRELKLMLYWDWS